MADIKISELTQVSALNNGDLVEVSQVNALAPSGYTSLKASMTDLGKKVNSDIDYTTELADFTDKTITGAIKETAKGKNVADEYDDTQTYDKGDVVIYKNTLYICNTNNTTGTWDATKWTVTNVQSLIGDLTTLTTSDKSSLVGAVNSQGVASAITPTSTKGTFSACYQSVVGDMVIVQGVFACSSTVTNGIIFTLPYGLKSGTNSSGFLMYDNTAKAYENVLIANSGDVSTIGTITTGHSYRFTFAYMK